MSSATHRSAGWLGLAAACAWLAACDDGSPAPASNEPPTVVLSAPLCAAVGEALDFDASATRDADGRVLVTRFLFGDGTPEVRTTASRARHAYVGPGVYEAVARAFDEDGAEGRASAIVRVYPRRVCAGSADCDVGERCEGALCRPDVSDGGVCAAPIAGCPPGSRACGTVTDLCGAMEVCMGGCCVEVKPEP